MSAALSILPIALRRLWAVRGLSLAALLALVITVALAVAVPVYADGASLRLLGEQLARQEQRSGRSGLALLARYLAPRGGALDWPEVAAADGAASRGAAELGLPLADLVRHARSPALPAALGPDGPPLLDLALGFLSGLDEQIVVVEGAAPDPSPAAGEPLEALAALALAERAGLNVGDELRLVARGADGRPAGVAVRIAGLWAPADPADPAWIYPPESFAELLLLPEASFSGPLAGRISGEVEQIAWFARLDGARLSAAGVAPLAGRVESLRVALAGLLPGARLEQSPAPALASYRAEAAALAAQLFVFGAPVLGLVLLFAALIAGQLVRGRSGEVALLKTRGVGDLPILGLFLAEWLALAAAALPLGAALGLALATLMSRTGAFLQLDPRLPAVTLSLTPGHLGVGLGALAVALAAVLAPAAAAARLSLAAAQRMASRPAGRPLWQRACLDLILLAAGGYGLHQLRAAGLSLDAAAGPELLANPLPALAPGILGLALGLLLLRALPPALGLAALLAARPAWTAPLLALRSLARRPEAYSGPLLLLALTLGLAISSAATAATIDGGLRRATDYAVGAPARLVEAGESTEQRGAEGRPERRDISAEPRFLFIPVDDHLGVAGVRAASRVGRYHARLSLGGRAVAAQLVGVDRLSLPAVLRGFEPAWAGGASLGDLMNRLAARPAGAVVGPELLEAGLRIGDTLTVEAELYGDRRAIELQIVGASALWPGFYPQDGPLLIVNLDYLFDQMGGQYPYEVWIDYDPAVPIESVAAGVRRLGVDLVAVVDAASQLREERARPLRQGLVGLLSIGFVTAGGLSVIGFGLAAAIAARGRSVELGVLRALGMGGAGAAAVLAIEQGLLTLVGMGAGAAIGLLLSLVAVPQLRVGAGPHPGTPPAPAEIPWAEMGLAAGLLAAALLLALAALGAALARTRLAAAVKLGDGG